VQKEVFGRFLIAQGESKRALKVKAGIERYAAASTKMKAKNKKIEY